MVTFTTIEQIVRRLVAPIHRRTRLTVLRAVVNSVDDTGDRQLLQVDLMDGQTRDNVEHFQPYGLTAVPPNNYVDALAFAVGGNQDHTVAVGVGGKYSSRPKNMVAGEVKLYDTQDSYVHLKSDGSVAISPGVLKVHIGGDPAATPAARSDLTDSRISALETAHNSLITAFNALVTLYNAHQHTSVATFQPAPAPGGTTVTVAAPTAPGSPGIALVPGTSTAATSVNIT